MGVDGTLQGLLDLAGIPFVGAGVLGSAVGMDKAMMKEIFIARGLPVAPYLLITRKRWRADPSYRPQNLVEWAKRKNVDPGQLQSSVRADDPSVAVPDP